MAAWSSWSWLFTALLLPHISTHAHAHKTWEGDYMSMEKYYKGYIILKKYDVTPFLGCVPSSVSLLALGLNLPYTHTHPARYSSTSLNPMGACDLV